MRKFIALTLSLCVLLCMFSSSYAVEKPAISSIFIKNKTVDIYNKVYDKTITEKLKVQYNLTDEKIKNYIGNSYFEMQSYNIDFVKSFDDRQVKTPTDIPLSISFDVSLWKSKDYIAIINIENINVVPKNNFKLEKQISFWFEYFNETNYDSINFEDDILLTTFKEPTQFMIGLNGFEIINTKNNEVYKNFPIYVYFCVPPVNIK